MEADAQVPVPLLMRLVNPRDKQFIELSATVAGDGYRLEISAGQPSEPAHAVETYADGAELLRRINGLLAQHRRAGYIDAIDLGPVSTTPIVFLPASQRPN